MHPVTFAGCFGWLHPGAAGRGVVICGAHGDEELFSHRAILVLASEIARQGLPCLRFDYRGTGNSIDDDLMPGRVEAWRGSVVDAAAYLRSATGVSEIALVGIGIGAMLAALAAPSIADLHSIAMLAPATSGRSYLQEMDIRTNLYEAFESRYTRFRFRRSEDRAALAEGRDIEMIGMTYTAETIADLGRVDLFGLAVAPAPRILLLKHPRRAADGRLAAQFRAWGCDVEDEDFIGYPAMMRGPADGAPPYAAFARVASWLAAPDMPAAPPVAAYPAADAVLRLGGMTETAALFGPGRAMFGIECRPAHAKPGSKLLVILNTWWYHHVGIGRLAVGMARNFAAAGYTSFRFDLGNTGDSPIVADDEPVRYLATALPDLRAALDHLQACGHCDVVLIGLCWGANLAAHASAQDKRVVGQVLINTQHLAEEGGVHFDPMMTEVDSLLILSDCDPLVPEIEALGLDRMPRSNETISAVVIEGADHTFRYLAGREALMRIIAEHLPRLGVRRKKEALLF